MALWVGREEKKKIRIYKKKVRKSRNSYLGYVNSIFLISNQDGYYSVNMKFLWDYVNFHLHGPMKFL